MKIAICDDDILQLKLLTEYCSNWSKVAKEPLEILTYPSAEAFLFAYEDGLSFDTLLLDIQMKTITGMDLAKHLRNLKDDVSIIFITGVKDYVFEGYHVQALDYILKPVDEAKLHTSLCKASESQLKKDDFILLEVGDQFIKLREKNICYVESTGHNSNLCTTTLPYQSKKGISALEKELSDKLFYRCHRCYLINISKIESISKTQVILEGGHILPIARGKWEGLNKAFLNYYRSCLC